MSATNPFPVTGTVTTESEDVTGYNFPCSLMWLSEHKSGDITEQIKNDLRMNYDVGVEADVTVRQSGRYQIENVRDWEEDDD